MANIITGIRILISAVLLFVPALSPAFYGLYIAAGISDMADGAVARKTDTVSAFGSRLDTAADCVFAAVCLIRLLPVLDVPVWLYVWIGVIAFIKVINVISGFIVQKKLVAVHSTMNRITGVLLFVLPLTLSLIPLKYTAPVVCAAATFAAVQEGHYIRSGKEIP